MTEEENKQVEEKMEEVQESENVSETEKEVVDEVVEEVEGNDNVQETKAQGKDDLYEEIELGEGISAEVNDQVLVVKKGDKEVRRVIVSLIDVKIDGNKIIISALRNRKIERKLFGTFKAHIKNMVKGMDEDFEYKLRVSNVHFPMNVSYDGGKKQFIIKNFLGEKKDRVIQCVEGVDVKVNGEDVIVTSHDIEKAGQVATSIEKGAKVRNKDRRIYQDGIFIIQKPGRTYLE